jgi:hypothetical protein
MEFALAVGAGHARSRGRFDGDLAVTGFTLEMYDRSH